MPPKRSYLASDSSADEFEGSLSSSDGEGAPESKSRRTEDILNGGNVADGDAFENMFKGTMMSTRSQKIMEKELAQEELMKKNSGMRISKRELNPDLARIRDLDEDKHEKELMDFYEKQTLKTNETDHVKTMQKLHRRTNECPYCPESTIFHRDRAHEILSMSVSMEGVYMCYVGARNCVHKYHFRISPLSHKPSVVSMDEDTYSYFRKQQERVVSFMKTLSLVPIFVEIASNLPSVEMLAMGGGNHCAVEVFPIPINQVEEAKMSFRAALESTGAEWSQHQKIIKTDAYKNAPRGIIPANIPYLHIGFGLEAGGYAHIVESGDDDLIDHSSASLKQFRQVVQSLYGLHMFDKAYKGKERWTEGLRLVRREMMTWGGDPNLLAEEEQKEEKEEKRVRTQVD